jgi:RNA polymerase sigma-70 factor (ECF subfamily)
MEVLAVLYQRYMDLVYGVCLKYLGEPEDARDAVINIFEELVTKLKKHEVDYFKAWLYQLSKNHCLMILRKKKNIPKHVDTEFVHLKDHSHPEDVLIREENLVHLEDCIGKLVNQQKESIQLFYLQGKCYKEISESTGIEINKVKSFIQNGRRNLKICMEKKAIEKVT